MITNRAILAKKGAVGWRLSNASYDALSLSVGSQDSGPNDVFFKPDGLKMYVVGSLNASVYQYTLTTAWDLSTATYDSVSFSFAAQSVGGFSLFFKPDGAKMYVLATTANRVYQYTLGTPWDISTATYATKSFSFAGQEAAKGMFFKPDGSKVYATGDFADSVFQYTLGTPWDVSTGSYDSVTLSVAAQDTAPSGLFFKPDGLTMYVVGDATNTVYQYALGTLWDLSTASYESVSFSVAAQDTAPSGIFIKPDGLKMYISGNQGDRVYQYNLP